MDIHIKGVRDLDGVFAKMMAIKLACDEAGSEYPKSVIEYFNGYQGEDEDVLRDMMDSIKISDAISKPHVEYQDVYEVDLSKLSSEVKRIRIVLSY